MQIFGWVLEILFACMYILYKASWDKCSLPLMPNQCTVYTVLCIGDADIVIKEKKDECLFSYWHLHYIIMNNSILFFSKIL